MTIKQYIILGAAVVIIAGGAGGWYAYQKNKAPQLVTSVDREIEEDDRVRIEATIAEIVAKIGDDRETKDFNLWIELGNYKNILGDLSGAAVAYRIAVELDTTSPVAYSNLAGVLTEMKDVAGAEAAYKTVIEMAPIEGYFDKYAEFLKENDRKEDYEKLLLNAIIKIGQQPSLVSRLAVFYESEGRLEDAKTFYEILLKLLPDDENTKQDLKRVEGKISNE
ncbi:MAG: hypothetical protein Q8P82_01605 [bacterium]|nr:hypothetical protein [bacterium]